MRRTGSFTRIAAVALLAVVAAVPLFAQFRGKADFTRFYTIGDSYGAGYQSGSMNVNHQQYSWPALIARQAGLSLCAPTAAATERCFAQPLVSYPGLPAGESQLAIVGGAIVPVTTPGQGAPLNSGFGRPYNNLSIPGANVADVTTITGAEQNPTRGPELLARFILRGLGTEVQQVAASQPTFVAIWIGGNDFLGAVTAGKPSLLTSKDAFQTAYNRMLDTLTVASPAAGMVVGTLPANFASTPFTSTLPPVVFDSNLQPVIVGGSPIPLFGDLGGGNIAALPTGSIVLLSALPRIQQGYGMPPALKAVPPFSALPHVGEPLSDTEIITPTEAVEFQTRIGEYNAIITAAAAARSIPVADITGLFNRFANGVAVGPVTLTKTFVRGGLFSLDGVHLSDMGYALFANEFIKAINKGYDTEIPVVGLSMFLQNNGAVSECCSAIGVDGPAMSSMISLLKPAETQAQPAPARRRASR